MWGDFGHVLTSPGLNIARRFYVRHHGNANQTNQSDIYRDGDRQDMSSQACWAG